KPRASPLWQCVSRHLAELRASGRVRRVVERNVLERFLECGDPHHGFDALPSTVRDVPVILGLLDRA
ncbi:MAG TPA: hypothetical protein VML57_12475, partial [Burkholderiales bacterium]|nr:hypothetical protein [Burkholderiales bacterium]